MLLGCGNSGTGHGKKRVGFLDLLTDETLSQAKKGFFMALKDRGYSVQQHNLEIVYRNAQGDQPTLGQACDYLVYSGVDLIATCPTLATITAVQKTKDIPVFMLVSPKPDLAGLVNSKGEAPANLLGVYETLDYLDTSVMIIGNILPGIKKIGTIYNQAEPQSVSALGHIEQRCRQLGIELVKMPVNNSNETQLVTEALLGKGIDAFFALPDNIVFSSMEVIVKSCDRARVPVFTSEEGLVKRGAVAAFGADMYQWGYQCGLQAARYLSGEKGLQPELVKVRRKVYNVEKAKTFKMEFDSLFTAVQ
jgi:putative ABC transport system substrate-binding protein